MSALDRLNAALLFLRLIRNRNGPFRLYDHPLLRDYLRCVQDCMGEVFNCRVAYGGSLALFLQGMTEHFGDYDIVTDRVFCESDLPWTVDFLTGHSLQVHSLDLDIFFRQNCGAALELSNAHIVDLSDGLRVQRADYVKSLNRLWHADVDCKQRLIIDDEAVDTALMDRLRRAWK